MLRVVVMVMVGAGGGDIWGWWNCYGGMLALGHVVFSCGAML